MTKSLANKSTRRTGKASGIVAVGGRGGKVQSQDFEFTERALRGVSGAGIRKLCVGDIAPDFDLPVLLKGVKGRFRLSEWVAKHKYVLVLFYPLNWEDLSARRAVELQAQREKYVRLRAEFVTVSVDSIMNTTAWEREIGPFDFPMCSDFWPHGEVCLKYGVLQGGPPQRGSAHTIVFVIDDKSTVRFEKSYAQEEVFSVDALVSVLNRFERA